MPNAFLSPKGFLSGLSQNDFLSPHSDLSQKLFLSPKGFLSHLSELKLLSGLSQNDFLSTLSPKGFLSQNDHLDCSFFSKYPLFGLSNQPSLSNEALFSSLLTNFLSGLSQNDFLSPPKLLSHLSPPEDLPL